MSHAAWFLLERFDDPMERRWIPVRATPDSDESRRGPAREGSGKSPRGGAPPRAVRGEGMLGESLAPVAVESQLDDTGRNDQRRTFHPRLPSIVPIRLRLAG